MCLCPPAWKIEAPTGRIFMKFGTWIFFFFPPKVCRDNSSFIISPEWRFIALSRMKTYVMMSLNFSWHEEYFLASSCVSVSARMENRGSHRTNFHEIWYLNIFLFFSKVCRDNSSFIIGPEWRFIALSRMKIYVMMSLNFSWHEEYFI